MDGRHTNSYRFLQDNLCHLGVVKIFGSATKSIAFYRGHDFDIGLFTDFKSKEFISDQIRAVSKKWHEHEHITLHVFVIGSFNREMIKENGLLIHYLSQWEHLCLWAEITFQKFIRFFARQPVPSGCRKSFWKRYQINSFLQRTRF